MLYCRDGLCLDEIHCIVYNDYMDRIPSPLDYLANRQTLAWLLVPVMVLPVAVTILFLFGQVFALLGDALSASILNWTALVFCIVWCLALVLLLLCTACLLLWENTERDY